MKITQYGHGICSANGKVCDCASADHSWAVSEERNRSGESDSSRFLVSGAVRSLWVRTRQGMLAEAMPRVRKELATAENAILESNSVMRFLRPDLYVTVLDAANCRFQINRTAIPRSRQRSCLARRRRRAFVEQRLVEAGGWPAHLPDHSPAICNVRIGGVCARKAGNAGNSQLAGRHTHWVSDVPLRCMASTEFPRIKVAGLSSRKYRQAARLA